MSRFDALSSFDARALFLRESGLHDECDAVRSIVERLGRERLPIVLAASHARALGIAGLLERLEDPVALFRSKASRLRAPVDAACRGLSADTKRILMIAAHADASFTLDVLERACAKKDVLAPVEKLLARSLLTRATSAGVVRLAVPWTVRHVLRQRRADRALAARWLSAWSSRARAIEPSSYGPDAPAAIAELACAVPVAVRALSSGAARDRTTAIDLWTKLEGALFFDGAIDFADPAFESFVAAADALAASNELRARARLIAARAMLERANVARAETLYEEASALVDRGGALDVDVSRGRGWSALAGARIADARDRFAAALALAESRADMRGQADAHAGLGMSALLAGEIERARDALRSSLAIHTVMRDARRASSVTAMMDLLPKKDERATSAPDAARLREEIEAHRAKGRRWREAIALARLGRIEEERGHADEAARLLREARVASRLSSMPAASRAEAIAARAPASPSIRVARDGRWMELAPGERRDLSRHGALKRILAALAVAHRDRAGVALSSTDLLAAGWPGEKMSHEAGMLRVYTTVRRLRALGLGDLLVTRDDGYLVDESAAIAIEP